jgi:beta-glucuronidase
MLYPQQNDKRNLMELSGFWNFQIDPENIGHEQHWQEKLPSPRLIAVPGSWNEQFQDIRNYLGVAWYQQTTYIPSQWHGQRIYIRVGSANYASSVYVNGKLAGSHEGGHLPFSFEITDMVNFDGSNTITLMVDAEMSPTTVPPGNMDAGIMAFFTGHPSTSFDFFPYSGIHRPVFVYALPENHISDVTVSTDIDGKDGIVKVKVEQSGNLIDGTLTLVGDSTNLTSSLNGDQIVELHVPNARLWCPDDPYLYDLTVSLQQDGKVIDRYTLPVGIRTIQVDGHQILLNGEPIKLKGFGKHEDFPIHGRGLNMPVIVKDASLLKWVGANSYRTSHYPYSEEAMMMADRQGFLIVDETPAVGLFFTDGEENIAKRFNTLKSQITELIARDKNHPSVIMWSLANEPMVGAGGFMGFFNPNVELAPESTPFFTELIELTRQLDPTRLVTVESPIGPMNVEWLHHVDVICTHQYPAWYIDSGRLEQGIEKMAKGLDALSAIYNKPIAVTEFGADTVAGWHSDPPEMWTEEYQVEQLRGLLAYADTHPFIAGIHLWNFADFRTGQSIMRAHGKNHKGIFTRDRQPKMAAHFLRSKWNNRTRET